MTRQRFWMALLAVAVAALVGLTVRLAFVSVGAEPESIALVRSLICSSCGHRYEGEISRPPLKCPKCSQDAVWPALQCTKCGTVLPCDRRKFRQEGREPYCPKCNSTQLASVPSSG